jgi:hypothetical protein
MEIEVRILVGRDEEGVRVTGEGVRDCPANQRHRRCGRRLALLRALVPATLLSSACFMSLGHVSRSNRLFVYLSICLFVSILATRGNAASIYFGTSERYVRSRRTRPDSDITGVGSVSILGLQFDCCLIASPKDIFRLML